MATSPATKQRIAPELHDDYGFDMEHPVNSGEQFNAVMLSPDCQHDWFKLADEFQTLASEGKTIWHCRTCAEVTNTYDWQTPES